MNLPQKVLRRFSVITTLFLLTLISTATILAESSSVDLSFNAKPSKTPVYGVGSVLQPDGKIIVFGELLYVNGAEKNQIARLNLDGSLDDSFNCEACDFNFTVTSVVVQADGKIIVSGYTSGSYQHAVVIRLNQDGSRDPSFVLPVIPIRWQISSAVVWAIQPDGKILIVINDKKLYLPQNPYSEQDSILRLNSDGSMDETFSRIYLASHYSHQAVRKVLLQPDGKILVAYKDTGEGSSGSVNRYNSDGTLDTTFQSPHVYTAFYGCINDIDVQPDGRIIISGCFTVVNSVSRANIARLLPNGTVDTSFVTPSTISSEDQGRTVKVLSNGQILVTLRDKIYRFNSNGSIDNTFNSPGNITNINNWILDSRGGILLFGKFSGKNGIVYKYARLNADGTLDRSFNVTLEIPGSVWTLAVQPDGKIIVGGDFSRMNNVPRRNIARLNADGSLDTTFDPGNVFDYTVMKVIVQPDGKILVLKGTSLYNGVSRIQLYRLNSDGSLDQAFNLITGYIDTIALQADGKIIIDGKYVVINGISGEGLRRLNSDGTLDASFNPITASYSIYSLFVQADGKILVGGRFSGGGGLIRLNSDGSLDDSFNTENLYDVIQIEALPDGKYLVLTNMVVRLNRNGTRDTSFQSQTYYSKVNVISAQPNGSVIVGGSFTSVNGVPRLNLIRLKPNGTLDTSFLPNGANGQVRTIIKQPDGKILVGGDFSYIGNANRVNVARLLISPFRNFTPFDFDGDGKADLSIFRPGSGEWYWLNSSSSQSSGQQFGASGDVIAPADFDGDGQTDLAVYRGGVWFIQRSSLGFMSVAFGASDDVPVPADYDGDGKADVAVWRPSDGTWYFLNSSNGQFVAVRFGQFGDKPTVGDFDGNGTSDIAVFRPDNGFWYRMNSSNQLVGFPFGEAGDLIVPADYDGDGKTDMAVYRPSVGVWYQQQSSLVFTAVQFGKVDDKPAPADYDGDGKADIAVYRPTGGVWHILRSTQGLTGVHFGASDDKPIPNVYVK